MLATLAIVVGGRGRGSNMAAIARACSADSLEARIGVVIAPDADCPALRTACELEVPIATIDPSGAEYETDLLHVLAETKTDFVCLAGFLRLLPAGVLTAFPNRVLNIHPALLPKFGGKGMYGMRVHEAVLASGDRESGCTVHLVNEEYDEGQILLQAKCPIFSNDTRETLASRVLSLEHVCYPQALTQFIASHGFAKQT